MDADADVLVIGGGHNGLVAAAMLLQAGLRVVVLEAADGVGGAVRTMETTLPGFRHDPYSAFYPLARVGPISQLPLEDHGLEWCTWPQPYGGATPEGKGVTLGRDVESSATLFDRASPGDGDGWRELFDWWRWGGPAFLSLLFHPLGHPAPVIRGAPLALSPRRLLTFAQQAGGSARAMAERHFAGEDARVWLVGSVLHSDLAPDDAVGGGFGLMLCGLAQQMGMPVPRGGAQAIPDALSRLIIEHGGSILTGQRVEQVVVRQGRAVAVRTRAGEFAARHAVLATVQPQALFLDLIGSSHLPSDFVKLVRRFRWGTGVFQLDLALSGLPNFRADALNGTLVMHLGRSVAELSRGVSEARRNTLPEHPLLVAGIHTLADASRAPAGRHTMWIMTHVPSRVDADSAGVIRPSAWGECREPFTQRILDELECYAPGIRSLVLGLRAQTPDDLAAANSNLVGGDIGTGSYTLDQQVVFRPLPGWFRHHTPVKGLYISGAATHPGGGVHGAPGANAASVLLTDLRLTRTSELLRRGLAESRRVFPTSGHSGGMRGSRRLLPASDGVGPLLQHDFWATLSGARLGPEELMDLVRRRFDELATSPFARFERLAGTHAALQRGDRIRVTLIPSRRDELEVVDVEPRNVTLQTVGSHPEAGRVTLAAIPLDKERTEFRVRIRSRANGWLSYAMHRAVGQALQAKVWRTLIERVAGACSARVLGGVQCRTAKVQETEADWKPLAVPTVAGTRED